MDKQNGILKKVLEIKNIELIAAALIGIIILSIYVSSISSDKKRNVDNKDISIQTNHTKNDLEQELETVLSNINKAGNVKVLITYKASKEKVAAYDKDESMTTTTENDSNGGKRTVTTENKTHNPIIMNNSNGSKPFIIKELEPEVKGVIVIAQGADDIKVKMDLMRAVKTVLNINLNQIEVFKMDDNHNK